jgi:hypothetical protein
MNEGAGGDVQPRQGRLEREGYVLSPTDLEGVVICSLSAGWLAAFTVWKVTDGSWIWASIGAVSALLCLWTVQSMCRRAWRTFWL